MKSFFSRLFVPFLFCFLILSFGLPTAADAALLNIQASPEVMIGLVALISFLITQVIKPVLENLSPALKAFAPIVIGIIATLLTGAEAGTSIGTILTGMLSGGVAMGGYDLGKCILGFLKLVGVQQTTAQPVKK